MKTLIYSLASICFILFIASCTKNDSVTPISPVPGIVKSGCDSTKMVQYTLINSTGVTSYEVAFAGKTNYTFSFPANGSTMVAVKPGNYSVFIYSPGSYAEHNFSLNSQQPIKESGARYDNVGITSCSGPQSITIAQ